MMRGCLLLTVMLVAVPPTASAQAARPDDPIRELLSEVRLLRQALERASTVGTRIQLLVARVQLQEQRIGDLSRRLDSVRAELRDVERESTGLAPQVAAMQETMQAEDPHERRAAEQAAAMLNSQMETLERRRQELSGEEGLLAQQIAAEQGRWTDFNNRLEQLERTLSK
jgi:chromosome segregation ATPase